MKKLLALVLALVMTLGLATVGANAAYKDADEVSYKEAVDVMTYVGVFQGNENGEFMPKAELDRASAAKLIAYLTAGEEVEGMAAAQKFADVPATHWAAKYVLYCATKGYIAGAGDGNFYPASKLTGYAFAKMLLCALGFDAKAEGFEGEGWEINVAKKVKNLKLNAGVDKALSAVLTREEAAQFCLNALQKNLVDYAGGGTMIVNGVTITNPGTLTTTDETLAHSLYGADINTTTGDDAFGRPSTTWKLGNKKIATYADEATLTYTTAVKGGKIYTALGKVNPEYLTVIEDGAEWEEEDYPTVGTGENQVTFDLTSGNKVEIGGTGVLTQVYYDADEDEATIILINTCVGKINKVNAAKKDADGDVTTPANIEVVDVEDGYTDNFDTDAFKAADKGTFVLYTKADGEIQSVTVADSEKDVTVRKLSAGKVNNYTVSFAGDDTYLPALERGASYDLYFDAYGNLIYATEVAAAENNNFVYVLKVGQPVGGYDEYGDPIVAETAKVLFIDATGKTTQVDADLDAFPTAGTWNTFTEKDGVYSFTENDEAVYGAANTIKASIPQLTAGLKANNNTTFVVKTKASPATYKVYEGLKNVPTMNKDNMLVTGINNDAGYAKLVYVDATDATGGSTTVATPVFVLDWVSDEIDDSGEVDVLYSVYNAIVGKELTTINVKDGVAVPEGIVTLTKDSKGYVTAFAAYDAALYDIYELDEDHTVAFVEGTLELPGQDAQVLDESVAVYVFEDGALTASTAGEELNGAATGTLVAMYKSNGAIDYFYWAK